MGYKIKEICSNIYSQSVQSQEKVGNGINFV